MTANLDLIDIVARRLGDLRSEVVFLGGAVTELLVTDPAAPANRPTADVDVIVEVSSHAAYAALSERLRKLGFAEDRSEGAPVCRWIVEGVTVDVMPTSEAVLGFGNQWYPAAIRQSQERSVGQLVLRLVTAPYFLATKLEAFDGRGKGDYRASHDLEDLIAVIDGRPEVVDEVATAPGELRTYLARRLGALLGEPLFREALPGHLSGDAISQKRVPIVLERIRKMTGR